MKNPFTVLERLTKKSHTKAKGHCKSLVTPYLPYLLSPHGSVYLRMLSTAAHLSVHRQHDLDLQKAISLVSNETGIGRDVITSIANLYVSQIEMGIDQSIKKFTPRGYL